MIAAYFSLTKPRMVAGNALIAAAAFIFGSGAAIQWPALGLMLLGLWLIVSSACALNNWYDRDIDARMERTQARAMARGALPPARALGWSLALLAAGVLILLSLNPLVLVSALFGWTAYALYTPVKHMSALALYVGAVAGAMPPVVGYVAASGQLDMWAGLLFAALYLWQLPHFIAISMYRFAEYRAAGVPLLVRQPSAPARRRARIAFYASLVVLLLFCLVLILQRWTR